MNTSPTRKTRKALLTVAPETRAPAKPPKAPKAKTPKAKATPPPTVDPLAGVTIKAQVLTYKPDYHRARIQIKTPTGRYCKLVPGVRTTTKAEALASAQAYRERILASGEVPAQAPRPDRFGWDAEAAEGMTLTTVDGQVIPLGGPDADDPA
jgi:hypothetical protein